MKYLLLFCLGLLAGCARDHTLAPVKSPAPATAATAASAPAVPGAADPEQVRMECIHGRRLICGKVLKILPGGLVVDSGYTDLMRPPLSRSWVIPGTVSVSRDANALETKEPGSPCIGLVFLTDTSKRQKVEPFDYVLIMGYPAGQYVYTPAPNIQKTIRKFAAGLDTAVRLTLQAQSGNAPADEPAAR